MASGEKKYYEAEIEEAKSSLSSAKSTLTSDVIPSLNSNFQVLEELGLISGGLSKIKTQAQALADAYDYVINALSTHESTERENETKVGSTVNSYTRTTGGTQSTGSSSDSGGRDPGDSHEGTPIHTEKPIVEEIEEGKTISTEELVELINDMKFEEIITLLKNIVKNGGLVTAMLTDKYSANILTYTLKNILGYEADLGKVTTSDDTLIQEKLLEKIANENENVFVKINENTYLTGMPYLKSIAKQNNLTVSQLILNDSNEKLLLKSLVDIYDGNTGTTLSTKEVEEVRTYLNTVAEKNGISTETLLSSENYISLIKGGV